MNKDMTVGEAQREFTFMVGLLIQRAYDTGYELTFGDAFAKDGHIDGSLHYSRLAVDFNLFKDGVYLTETEDHKPLGQFWEQIGGSWGGRFSNPDGNHYSLGETRG
jgi:hypothetical protein